MSKPIVALQMDPLSTINVKFDTTFALGLEAQNRGFQLFVYSPVDLSYVEGQIIARGYWVTFIDQDKDFYVAGEKVILNLAEVAFVLMRQNPPFDMAYIAATHLLELLPSTTRVINDAIGVRNAPEKLLVALFPDLMPPTLISQDIGIIEEFIRTHGAVILKPIFEFGGNGITLIKAGDQNLKDVLETYQKHYDTPPILQKFLPEVEQGDKRIILINGDPVGIFKRIPPPGEVRSNMRVGGYPEPCDLSDRDQEICKRIGETLRERGLYLAGIDVIGDFLTEINVTSPTGVPILKQLYDIDAAKVFWDGLG